MDPLHQAQGVCVCVCPSFGLIDTQIQQNRSTSFFISVNQVES